MAIAGRVAIVPKGKWLATLSYSKLDMVTYNSNAYVAYKDSVGIEPTNEEYWMLTIENVTAKDLAELQTNVKALFDGTTPAGDSKKLNGLAAEEFVKGVSPYFVSGETILSWASNPQGIYKKFVVDANGYPSDAPIEGEGFVELDITASRIIATFTTYVGDKQTVYKRKITSNAWVTDWSNSADGGNADTVDGYHAYEFQPYHPVNDKPYTDAVGRLEWNSTNKVFEWKVTQGETEYGVNADTVDNHHAYQFQPIDQEMNAFSDIKAYLEWQSTGDYVGYMKWKALHDSQGVTYPIMVDNADTVDGYHASDFFPSTGGTLSGNIGIGTGYASVACDNNHVKVSSFCDASNHTDNYRVIAVVNQKVSNDIRDALQFQNVENGIITNYVVLHTGNSAPVAIQESAPSDTTALWYDIANKKIKAYIDGAWTATA